MKPTLLVITTLVFIFSLGLQAQQQTADGGYIIAGSTDSYGDDCDFLVYKLDARGNKTWRKNYGGIEYDLAVKIEQTSDGGYVVAGWTGSYGPGAGFYSNMLVYKLDAAGAKQWRKYYGSTYPDKAFDVIQTSDGGYLMIGYSQNFVHGSPPFERDFLVYRLDSSGNQLWRKNYGGTQKDVGLRAVQTPDGGYAFLGYTYSYTNGSADFLVYKVDPEGAKQWRKNYGGGGEDFGLFIRQTSDGGYILSGTSETYIHVPYTVANTDTRDILVYRLNASGAKLWRKNFGGVNREEGFDIQQTLDGGFVVCGFSETYTHGEEDMIVYRLDAAGNKLWRKNYGGSLEDVARYIVCSSDGGFLLYGHTESYTNGGSDFLVYRLDASGAKLWRKNYGGGSNEKIDPWD